MAVVSCVVWVEVVLVERSERRREVLMAVDGAALEAFFIGNFDHLVSLSLCPFPFKKP